MHKQKKYEAQKHTYKKLYGLFDIDWNLDAKVNILAGINGSFKSTVLHILEIILTGKFPTDYEVSEVTIHFEHNYSIYYKDIEDNLFNLQQQAQSDEVTKELISQLYRNVQGENNDELMNKVIHASVLYAIVDGRRIPMQQLQEKIHFDFISTFDRLMASTEEKMSYLDKQLSALQSDYAYFLSDLSKKLANLLTHSEGNVEKDKIQSIYAPKKQFIDTVNELFAGTNKQLDAEESKLTFMAKGGRKITIKQLSSGEKQMLIILLTALLERTSPFLLLMDEPEISLHLEWQKRLIEIIQRFNPECQVVMTTHSPGMIYNGWGDFVVEMENIVTPG